MIRRDSWILPLRHAGTKHTVYLCFSVNNRHPATMGAVSAASMRPRGSQLLCLHVWIGWSVNAAAARQRRSVPHCALVIVPGPLLS